ncbi:hypothetical protein V6N13_102321 [Hibiscus sabdariffa]
MCRVWKELGVVLGSPPVVLGSPRIRSFLWMVYWDKILTNTERAHRSLAGDANCSYCGPTCEDTLHILRDCPAALALWTLLIKPERLGEFLSLALREWLRSNLDNDCCFPKNSLHWDIMFVYILWNLWTQRNARIFDADSVFHEYVLERCRHLVSEVCAGVMQRQVTCNADGSFRVETGCDVWGSVAESPWGVDCRLCQKYGICSAIEAELWVIYECLKYASELGITRLRLVSDCGRAIQALENRGVRGSISLIHHIWDFLDKQCEVLLIVINRERNKVADALAHLAWKLLFGFHDFVDPPNDISYVLMSDLSG